MRTGRLALVLVVLTPIALSCVFSLSEDQSRTCRQAERLGKEIYEQDAVSSKAADALAAEVDIPYSGVRGWITIKRDIGWRVRFVGMSDGVPAVYYDVDIDSDAACHALQHGAPVSLDKIEASMHRARQSAIAAMTDPCGSQYNTVILPQKGDPGDGWLVYLLAASDKNEIVVGGHFRSDVTPDGGRVRHMERLTLGCLRGDRNAMPEDTVGIVTTHHASPTPNEAHVFLSLLHKMPIFVATEAGAWSVSDGRIQFASEWPKDGSRPGETPNSSLQQPGARPATTDSK